LSLKFVPFLPRQHTAQHLARGLPKPGPHTASRYAKGATAAAPSRPTERPPEGGSDPLPLGGGLVYQKE